MSHILVGRLSEKEKFEQALSYAANLEAVFKTVVREITVYHIEHETTRLVDFSVRLGLEEER